MKKKLLIYETTHYETLPALIELSLEKFEEITIFAATPSIQVDDNYFPVFHNKNIKWHTKAAAQSHRHFLKELFKELQKDYSHFFINSLDNNLLYAAIKLSLFKKKIHVVLNVHCIHDYVKFRYHTFISATESIAKKILHRRIRHYRVLAPAMPVHLKSFLSAIEVEYVPGLFFRQFERIDFSKSPFQIVVPGAVEKKRRIYESLPAILRELGRLLSPGQKIELVLLGNSNTPYGQHVRTGIRSVIAGLSITLITFDNEVGYKTFSSYYANAHIVWSPIRRNTKSIRGEDEINGLSNSAGLIVDFPHYARPALIPADISFSAGIDNILFRYATPDEAVSFLHNFINNYKILEEQKKQIEDLCSGYTVSQFRTAFNRVMKL